MNNECNCSKSLSTGGEYPCKKLACIKEQKPDCMAAAVIPSITVETADGITNLANCLVHVLSTNTTYYVDDKHRILITWAGPVDIPGYDMETNPDGYKNQIVTDTENQVAVIYDAHGVGYTFGIEQGADVQDAVNTKIDEMAANGELADIVMDVLALQAMFAYDTVADMKAAENLVDGSIVETLGYHAKGDYGAATYSISDDSLTANGSTIIALDNGLFAVLNLSERAIKCEQFGAYGDGTHDDTAAVQSAIDYSIAHECVLEFNGDYLVEPTLQEDSTMVCLKYSKRNTGIQYVGTQIRFNRSARLKTDYADECTLLRIEARNIVISEGYFSGVQGKTTLMEFSRTDKLATTQLGHNMDNIIENCIFRYAKNAITLEGSAYYNKFNSDRIFSCTNGIVLQMTALEKAGLRQDSNVNRNHFNDICMNSISGWAVRIEYGAHNEFVGLDIEGAGNGVYIDNPYFHSGDFPIAPANSCDSNKFVNVMMESITSTNWYNNQYGTCIYNTIYESDWGSKSNMVIQPQVFVGGDSPSGSIEKVGNMTFNKDLAAGNMPTNTAVSGQTLTVPNLYDYATSGGVYSEGLKLQPIEFNIDGNASNITSLTYNSSKPLIKRIGGIIHLTGSFYFSVSNTSSQVQLYLPNKAWLAPKPVANNFIQPATYVPAFVNNAYTPVYIRVVNDAYGTRLAVSAPAGGWAATNYLLLSDFTYLSNVTV